MGVALRWRAERLGLVLGVVCALPLILEILSPADLVFFLNMTPFLGANLAYAIQISCCLDADYLFLKGVSRPQMLAGCWVRVAVVGLLFWIDWAIALRASTGMVTRAQAEVLLLALATTLLAAGVTKPGSWLQSVGKKPPGFWLWSFWLFTNAIPICVSFVLVNQRNQGRDLYPAICLLGLAATPLCGLVTLRAWNRSDLPSSIAPARP